MPTISVNGFEMHYQVRGHGRSTNPGGAFTFRQCAQDVLALLDGPMVLVSATPRFPEALRVAAAQFTPESFDRLTDQERDTLRQRHIHGDRDPYYPVEMALELFQGIPHSALWVVPYGAHGPVFGPLAPAFVHLAVEHLGRASTR